MVHKQVRTISCDELKTLIHGKVFYIWGAGNQGRGLKRVLNDNLIFPEGFIDQSPQLNGKMINGLKVVSPEILNEIKGKLFIVIAAFFYEDEIAERCRSIGLSHTRDFIHYSQLKPRDYSIEVSGRCNLRCLSCPRASARGRLNSEMMHLDDFKRVIDKIKQEDPFVGNIQLYQWGEPALNRHLPEMITYANEKNISSAISSNLNCRIDYESIVKAKPGWFRISASGWKENYELAHTGGKWSVFYDNLLQIARLRTRFNPEMKIELYYHLYKHSVGDGYLNFEKFCKDNDIEFHPVCAYLISLDDVLRYQQGEPLPEPAETIKPQFFFDLDAGLSLAREQSDQPCDSFRCVHINSDLSVSNCMMYFYPDNNRAADNFLKEKVSAIMAKRKACHLCRQCSQYSMHRYCYVFSTLKPEKNTLISDG